MMQLHKNSKMYKVYNVVGFKVHVFEPPVMIIDIMKVDQKIISCAFTCESVDKRFTWENSECLDAY